MKKTEIENALKDAQTEILRLKAELEKAQAEQAKTINIEDATAPIQDLSLKIQLLMKAVKLSCQDHCPHKGNKAACANCSISQLLEQAKIDIQEN